MEPHRIQAVDHVYLQAPQALEDELQWFYGEVGGLELISNESAAAPRMRFRSARLELRIAMVEEPRVETVTRRVTLLVPSLDGVAAMLDERLVSYEWRSGLMFTDRRLGTRDPAGNRVELKQRRPNTSL